MRILQNEDGFCRQCLNSGHGMNLQPRDCRYSAYAMSCPACGKMHQIPVGFRLRGKVKILLRKKKAPAAE